MYIKNDAHVMYLYNLYFCTFGQVCTLNAIGNNKILKYKFLIKNP